MLSLHLYNMNYYNNYYWHFGIVCAATFMIFGNNSKSQWSFVNMVKVPLVRKNVCYNLKICCFGAYLSVILVCNVNIVYHFVWFHFKSVLSIYLEIIDVGVVRYYIEVKAKFGKNRRTILFYSIGFG